LSNLNVLAAVSKGNLLRTAITFKNQIQTLKWIVITIQAYWRVRQNSITLHTINSKRNLSHKTKKLIVWELQDGIMSSDK